MIKVNKVLYPTDFSRCAEQALMHALHWAQNYQAELHLFHAIVLLDTGPYDPQDNFPNLEELHDHLKRASSERLASSLAAHKVDNLTVKQVQVRAFSPAPAILEYAEENDIDLIVMGTHGRRGLGHLFLGSVAEEVVRMGSCPVLTVRERKQPIPVEAMEQLLVPVDFSDHCQEALLYAKQMAAFYGARLQLLHVVEEVVHPAFYMSDSPTFLDFVPEIKVKSRQAMEQLLEEVPGPEVKAETYVIEGRAAADIGPFADTHDTDLIVISTHGLTGLKHLLLGSVTEKVVRFAPCPVFTVKPFGKSLLGKD